ncbi:MAG: hypothetical protein ABIH41_05345 [Nanoarchaeota archaeon]
MPDRLFVNLSTEPYLDFLERGKRYEIRAYGRNGFHEANVYDGRPVELRRAWSRGSIFGTVGEVVVGSIDDIFDAIDYALIEPRVRTREEAVAENRTMLKNPEKYIAFEVINLSSSEDRASL